MVVVGNVYHMVRVDSSERSQAITNNGEESDQDVVDDVDDVRLATSDIDPSDQEENPSETEQGDQGCIYSDKQTKGWKRKG